MPTPTPAAPHGSVSAFSKMAARCALPSAPARSLIDRPGHVSTTSQGTLRRHRQAELEGAVRVRERVFRAAAGQDRHQHRSEEHTSELQSLMRTSYAVFCLKKKNNK